MTQLSVAIIGTGTIARIHAEALLNLGDGRSGDRGGSGDPGDQAKVVAAADIDPGRLREFCSRYGIAECRGGLAGLLDDGPPDLVVVCTPPGAHAGQALSCLRAGSSVLVEKPPALSLAELQDMADAERPGGPWLATVFQHRFGSGARRLRTMIDSGVLGRPLLAVCHTLWFRDQAYFDAPWRGRWDTEGGGPTMGHGIHQMDLLGYLLGDWTEVSALARRQARRTETEDLSLAHVTFASGAVASVVNSVLSPREESYLRFDFEHATVEVTHLYGYGDDDWRVTPAPGRDEEVLTAWEHAASAGGGPAGGSGPAGGISAARAGRSGHAAQFAHVIAALRDGRRPPVGPAQTRGTLSLVAGIYASAFARRPVTPDYLAPGTPFYQRMNGPMDGGTPA
jgi:predicted dehydrogenase